MKPKQAGRFLKKKLTVLFEAQAGRLVSKKKKKKKEFRVLFEMLPLRFERE